ncbi:hypothetical protein L1887_25366 [Cichorium endivia]|nr:hypothetical protein L1887_25366 [Cichorium endivia]
MGERRLPRDADGERRRRWSGRRSRRRYSPMEEMPSRRRCSLQSDGGDEAERCSRRSSRRCREGGDVAGVAAMRERRRMQIRMDRDDGGGLQQRSLDIRQLSKDGRMRNPEEKPLMEVSRTFVMETEEREKRVKKKMQASVPVVDVEETTMAVEKTSDVTMVLFALL